MRNIFIEKSYTKCCRETSPRSFSEKLKLSVSLSVAKNYLRLEIAPLIQYQNKMTECNT